MKKTATDTWTLDTSTYLTANQNITVSGDATGSGTTSIPLTLANSGVTAGTYNNSATSVQPITVDAKGRVTNIGSAVTITPAFSSITGKPTTLGGYGITDAAPLSHTSDLTLHLTSAQNTWIDAITATSTEVNYLSGVTSAIQTQLGSKQPLDADLTAIAALAGTSGLLKKTAADTWTLDTSTYLTANQNITLSGDITGSGATTISTVLANSGVTAGTYENSATTITPLNIDAKGRITGTGSPVTITPAFSSITGKPTTLGGYGITDAAPLTHISDLTLHLTSAQNTWIDAITVTSTEVNYLNGASSNVQTQLNNKQALDADLTAIAALAGTSGYLKKTAADTWTLDTTLGSLTTLSNGMPAYIESTGGKTVSISRFDIDFAMAGANRNLYLAFGDSVVSSTTYGYVIPDNCTLTKVIILAKKTLAATTIALRLNGSTTATASYNLALSTVEVSSNYNESLNLNANDVVAIYAASSGNFNDIVVKLIFAWR